VDTRAVARIEYKIVSASNGISISICFCDDFWIPEGGQKAKAMIQLYMTNMFKKQEFHEEEENAKKLLLGSHSIRKFASSYARSCGIHNEKKTLGVRGKAKVVCQMFMMIQIFHKLFSPTQECCRWNPVGLHHP
jgi:hypothetical protein